MIFGREIQMNQIERITEMEEKLNRARKALDVFSEALAAYRDVQDDLRALSRLLR